MAKLILDSNAEVNVPSGSENNIPLTLACWKGTVKELLSNLQFSVKKIFLLVQVLFYSVFTNLRLQKTLTETLHTTNNKLLQQSETDHLFNVILLPEN